MKRLWLALILLLAVFQANALSLALDSIREWGKFPNFCVDVYRWGDRFFNTYDSAYVVGTGHKFNLKLRTESWVDYYNFDLPNDMRMRMLSDPSTSTGFWLTYLAVSVGYDMNVSKYLGFTSGARKRFTFGFNCSLFAVDYYSVSNDVGTHISKFGPHGNTTNPKIDFNGINNNSWGLNFYYFFNHKKYSQAAAFNFSKIQKRSQGSLYAGFSFWRQKFIFDFSSLPDYMKDALPATWPDYTYRASNNNYALKVGYGYNWVFAPKWILGVSESPLLGIQTGWIDFPDKKKTSFAFYNNFRLSVVWNNKQWFAGAQCDVNIGLLYDKEYTFTNSIVTGIVSVGYRFNIW